MLSEVERDNAQLSDNGLSANNGKVIIIQQQPIMECALDVLTTLGAFGKIILRAKGEAIPTAVAVANVVTQNMMKGNSQILDIIVDSENTNGKYGMTLISTIQITIVKKIN